MFSSRLNWGIPANPLSRLLAEKRALGVAILDLTESNPTSAGFTYPVDRILPALADPRSLCYEPAPAGILAARSAVSKYYGGKVDAGRILLTASTSEAYALLFKLLADPGDEVLVPRPSYPLFDFLAALESVHVVEYSLVYHAGWEIDFDALARKITPRTRVIVVVNPNNPTGSYLKKSELSELTELCRRHDLAILSDEVFSDYALADDPRRVASLVNVNDALTFSLSGLSKLVGLPQLKLGWIVASGPPAACEQALERLELIADTYLSVGTPVQWAAAPLLALRESMQAQILERVHGNLAYLRSQIGPDSPWRVLEPEGGWYAVIQAPRIHTEEDWVLTLLGEDHVLIQPGFFFDFESEAFLVASLLTPREIFQEGIRRILARAAS
jgi:aspartate/methionine/tyrosine aminotransferase